MKHNLRLLVLSILILPFVSLEAKEDLDIVFIPIDTVSVHSQKMDSTIRNVVILPDQYQKSLEGDSTRFPVVYLLHGHAGSHKAWIDNTKPKLREQATRYGVIIVCPDAQNSWYWDSKTNKTQQYETYMSKELISYIDENYRTIASPKHRAISGYSMGGHGALFLAINHPDVFGACGSMSGGLDLRPFSLNWSVTQALGSYVDNEELWGNHTVLGSLYKIQPNSLAIIIDCGTEDFFFKVNEKVHEEMLYRNIKHDYIVRPGGHSHLYWNSSVEYHFLFFSQFFNRAN